ncbi:MAG: DUF58 domain-containing protein [Lentisphaeria bacterium]|nr:DUF58 domain-containing protein [Lentisphaeria bacterium]
MKFLAKYLNPKAISAIGGFAFNPKGLVEGNIAGAHKSPFHGFSVEFAGHREYMPGDDTKHIDWNVYYKSDKYLIKQYEAETNMICQLFLDASESMRYGSHEHTKLDYANYLAISLSYLITKARDSIGLGIFDEKVTDYFPPSNSMASVYKLNAALEGLQPTKKTEIDKTLMDFAHRCGRRQLVMIISDCLLNPDELSHGLARLHYDHHEIILFHIVDPYEIEFPMDGRVKFIGLEGFAELKLQPKQIRKAYLEKMTNHIAKLRENCDKVGAEYVQVNTAKPIEETLMSYLGSRLTHIVR